VDIENCVCRYFVSYSGVKLPLQLVNELVNESELQNRNTFFRGYFDAEKRLLLCQKLVYGEVELEHKYSYHDNGALRLAEITDVDDELTLLHFDEAGLPLPEG